MVNELCVDPISNLSPFTKYVNWNSKRALEQLGMALNLKRQAIATCMVYFLRFVNQQGCPNDPSLLMATVIYFACKVEECPLASRSILGQFQKGTAPVQWDISELHDFEFHLLQALDFSLIVHHPYPFLILFLKDLALEEHLESCWSVMNDLYKTGCILSFPPHLLALSTLYFVLKLKNAFTPEIADWIKGFQTDFTPMTWIVQSLLEFYEWKSLEDAH